MNNAADRWSPIDAFEHEALLYDGPDDFLSRTVPFLTAGLEARDPMLVAVPAPRIRALQAELGDGADEITFVDMLELGVNPARILPAWTAFLSQAELQGGTPRGVGEPVWFGRNADELAECERHEALLNVAFAGRRPWLLLCPYDVAALPAAVLDAAERTHCAVHRRGRRTPTATYPDLEAMALPHTAPLTPIPAHARTLTFGVAELRSVRHLVAEVARAGELAPNRADDLALAAHELATNSILHGGHIGVVNVWLHDGAVVVDVRDAGEIHDVLVGRRHPHPDSIGGRGVWMANQLCDLVQVRQIPTGTAVRLHQRTS
jgi:anti-sigma regulatory factor (Ser/Thr protein kinase)